MPAMQQIEKQIQTIDGLRDIIHSMRSLAATYLSRAEERLDGVRGYAETVGGAIGDCLVGREIALPDAGRGGAAVIAFFSEQGLCGRFNEVIAEAAEANAAQLGGGLRSGRRNGKSRAEGGKRMASPESRSGAPVFIAVGRRGPALLRAQGLDLAAEIPSVTSPDGVDGVIHQISRTVLDLHRKGQFAQLYILYAHHLSPGRIAPTFERVLPIDLAQWRDLERTGAAPPRLALGRLMLLQDLVYEYAFISLYRAMTESIAGENGMRLQSMEAARSNIDETLEDLRLQASIERQNQITGELLDVVSGAEALSVEG